MSRTARIVRKTGETDITLTLTMDTREPSRIDMGVPFLVHMLNSMAFHGGFSLNIRGTGDIEVDPHHLVEDLGLVLGDALTEIRRTSGPCLRFGHSVIPMDEALSEVTVDAAGRPCLVYQADYPQSRAGDFDLCLVREFLLALSNRAGMNIHALCRYGENSHHMAEALFKALGKAVAQALTPVEAEGALSTKGLLE